eukprot:TRINITY_DN9802_c0_g1_i5.p1 TRINITY_DN9802_c0_g1~~TRINITY_DN9802_c0_g1_i5.p1  ORF type:complete len:513 (+),score=60.15 TRINITY_DN9802_c0_g1_i5:537-2075(+)
MRNLAEMNRLWVRLCLSGSKTRLQREADRNELSMIVGENVVRLSSLEGVDLSLYTSSVLPRLFDIIQNCKDPLSQQYLADCIIQVFPDEYHLQTLESLLEGCGKLSEKVDLKGIYVTLMNRLANYAASHVEEMKAQNNMFEIIKRRIDWILENQGAAAELKNFIELEVAFIRFSIKCYPKNIDYINSILGSVTKLLQVQASKSITLDSLKSLFKLLSIPLDSLALDTLNLSYFPILMEYLNLQMKKDIAKRILHALVTAGKRLNSLDLVEKLLTFTAPLVEGIAVAESDEYEFEQVQGNVAKIAHLLEFDNCAHEFQAIHILNKAFVNGGVARMRITIPSLVWALYRLSSKMASTLEEDQFRSDFAKIYGLALQLIESIVEMAPEDCIKLLLNGVLTISLNEIEGEKIEDTIVQYITRAFAIYYEEIANSNSKLRILLSIIGTLERAHLLSSNNFNTLAKQTIQACTKLLRKQDQCKALLACSHVFASSHIVNSVCELECYCKCRPVFKKST